MKFVYLHMFYIKIFCFYADHQVEQGQSLVPFGCLPSRNVAKAPHMMHAWDLFLKYYELKVITLLSSPFIFKTSIPSTLS